MATQYKKIQNKIHPKDSAVTKTKSNLKPKATRDALLLVLMAMTLVILLLAWSNMDNIGRGMYTTMLLGMIVVYVNRMLDFGDQIRKVLIGVSSSLLVASMCLLGYSLYLQFFK